MGTSSSYVTMTSGLTVALLAVLAGSAAGSTVSPQTVAGAGSAVSAQTAATPATVAARAPLSGGALTDVATPPRVVKDYEIVAAYPHDTRAYTQGLFWHDGYLYEGTGRYGTSWLRKVDPQSGEVLQETSLPTNFFGEGIVLFGDRVFQLTWLSKRGFIYDLETFERVGEFTYETEGWGLTSDGTHLILSDGSDTLHFLDPSDQRVAHTVQVRHQGEPVDALNELEHIGDLVYANVWHSDFIYRIDAATGVVVDRLDFSDLLGADERPRDTEAVLNGIAYNPRSGHLFLTGKQWPKVFEVRLTDPGGGERRRRVRAANPATIDRR
jgi:glutaminyl-peptide cyclotransferase